jgi:hypothetical protein
MERHGWEALTGLEQYAVMATGLIVAVAFIFRAAILALALADRDLVFWLTNVQWVVGAVWGLLWYITADQELNLAKKVGEAFVRPIPGSATWYVIGAALTFGLVFVASASVWSFAAALLVLKLVEVWGASILNRLLRAGLGELREVRQKHPDAIPADTMAAAEILETYYLRRRWDRLRLVGSAVLLLAVVFALYAAAVPHTTWSEAITVAASVASIAAIVGNEVVAFRWRALRDRAIAERAPRFLW